MGVRVRHPSPALNLGPWPELEWNSWRTTAETLQLYLQIAGKVRLALTSTQNHWWNVPLYVTARGLGTSAMPVHGGGLLEIEFDFVAHRVVFRTSAGAVKEMALAARPVADFYAEFRRVLAGLGVEVELDPMPVELANPIRFDADFEHGSYDAEAVGRFWHALRLTDTLLKRFSTNFYGKISPVHFFWGSFDLAVSRFNGRRAPARPGADGIQAEAYSHEVISAGFWPGNGGYGRAAVYAYAAPVPEGLSATKLRGAGRFDGKLGEFVLDYGEVLQAGDPAATVLGFLEETYSAAADAAGWDRAALDRRDEVGQAAVSVSG